MRGCSEPVWCWFKSNLGPRLGLSLKERRLRFSVGRDDGAARRVVQDNVSTETEAIVSLDITQQRVLKSTELGHLRWWDVDDTVIGYDHVLLEFKVVHDVPQVDRTHALNPVLANVEHADRVH